MDTWLTALAKTESIAVLLASGVIYWLFKLIFLKEKTIERLTEQLSKNTSVTEQVLTLLRQVKQ